MIILGKPAEIESDALEYFPGQPARATGAVLPDVLEDVGHLQSLRKVHANRYFTSGQQVKITRRSVKAVVLVSNMRHDPETFLSRIAIVAEGLTEFGFVDFLLRRAIGDDLLDRGIWITDGGGNDSTLTLLEALVDSRLKFAGFADDEGRAPTRWAAVQQKLGPLLLRWPAGSVEENIIKLVRPIVSKNSSETQVGWAGHW